MESEVIEKGSPDQPRDEKGRWASGAATARAASADKAAAHHTNMSATHEAAQTRELSRNQLHAAAAKAHNAAAFHYRSAAHFDRGGHHLLAQLANGRAQRYANDAHTRSDALGGQFAGRRPPK